MHQPNPPRKPQGAAAAAAALPHRREHGRSLPIRKCALPYHGSLRLRGLCQRSGTGRQAGEKRYDPILTPQGAAWFPRATSVDTSMLGALPLELYLQTGNKDYIPLGKDRADTQWSVLLNDEPITSQGAPDGSTTCSMIPAVQMQAYRGTKEDKQYMDHAALTASVYLRRLQRDDGLFYHRIPPEGATTPNAPFYWSRGNGWVAAGLSEILINLPKDHEHYKDILAGYQKMMAGLLKTQGADGMWHQLLDHPESFAETSGTGMFTFAFALGVKNGWLEGPAYKEATKKAWIAAWPGMWMRRQEMYATCAAGQIRRMM